ncbi:MAG: phage portal protein [Opitutaceae bacterium]
MRWPWTKRESRRRGGIAMRGFAAAEVDRLLAGWKWDGGYSAQEITAQLPLMRSRSREMAKNSAHSKRFLKLGATNIVGEGFAFKSTPHDEPRGKSGERTLDDAAARFIQYHWWRFCTARDPLTLRTYFDATGRKTEAEVDRLNAKTWLRDGEYFMLIEPAANPYGITFRVVRPDACPEWYNADRLENGNIVRCGVELSFPDLAPVAYYFRTEPDYAYVVTSRGPLTRIPAHRVIHGFTQEDEDQPRGVPETHAAIIKLKMLEEYDKAELTAARDEACSLRSYYAPKGDGEEIADLTSEDNSDVAAALIAEKEPGQSEVLPIGWKQEVHTPQHPNREVTPFKVSMLKDVATGFGVEYSAWANDWSGVSFSSVRSGTICERDMWMVMQADMISQSKVRQFMAWMRSFLSLSISGDLPPEKFNKFAEHMFRGRRWMWVQPVDDMKAAEMAVAHGWKTNEQVTSDLGGDFDDNCETLGREQPAVEKLGLGPINPNATKEETGGNDETQKQEAVKP